VVAKIVVDRPARLPPRHPLATKEDVFVGDHAGEIRFDERVARAAVPVELVVGAAAGLIFLHAAAVAVVGVSDAGSDGHVVFRVVGVSGRRARRRRLRQQIAGRVVAIAADAVVRAHALAEHGNIVALGHRSREQVGPDVVAEAESPIVRAAGGLRGAARVRPRARVPAGGVAGWSGVAGGAADLHVTLQAERGGVGCRRRRAGHRARLRRPRRPRRPHRRFETGAGVKTLCALALAYFQRNHPPSHDPLLRSQGRPPALMLITLRFLPRNNRGDVARTGDLSGIREHLK